MVLWITRSAYQVISDHPHTGTSAINTLFILT